MESTRQTSPVKATSKKARATIAVAVSASAISMIAAGSAMAEAATTGQPSRTSTGIELPRANPATALTNARAARDAEAAVARRSQLRSNRATTVRAATAACVNKKTGAVRIGRCKSGEKALTLATGDVRPSTSIYKVVSPVYTVAPGEYIDFTATCTSGGKAISGSFYQTETTLAFLNESYQPANVAQWAYSFTNGSSTYSTYPFFVTVCAK